MSVYNNNIPDIRWRKFEFSVNPRFVNKSIIASIFWGFYEGAEIRFIEKYFNGRYDVIELGGSIGIVSSHILNKLHPGKKVITVEANPYLLDTIETNLVKHTKANVSFKVLNKAISYGSDDLYINVTDNNTESTISTEKIHGKTSILIQVSTLSKIIKNENMHEIVLVCDIEGSEIEIILNDDMALKDCRQLFIELHQAHYKGSDYSVDDLKILLQSRHHFNLIDQHGPVCFFEKKS